MNKIFPVAALWICCISAFGHTHFTVLQSHMLVPDTIYIYETVIVYDTIFIRDTVRVKKAMNMPIIQPIDMPDSNNISLSPTATFSENSIIYKDNVKKSNDQVKIKEMKLNILNYASAAILAAHTFSGISAQETNQATDEEPLTTMPIQFTVAYPLTSMGEKTKDYRFHFSANLFSGMVGAVKGVEFGCILNYVVRDMTGAQFAGIGNRTREVNGAQFAVIFNVSSTVKGAQYGGITNITKDVSGIQYGGIANISESVHGVQFGGIANLSETVDYGIQFGGIANVSRNVNGIQFGGIANVSENVVGMQFAGIGNVSKKIDGIQFGGIFNRTETLRGLQFAGIVNITDTIENGASIALINIVKKGFYHAWEFSFADYLNAGVSFKMGTRKLYTIFTAGTNFMEDKLWVFGIGFGNRTTLSQRFDFQPEIVGYQYYPFKNLENTSVTHLKIGFICKLNDRLGITIAPSVYHYYAAHMSKNDDYYKVSPFSPFYKNENKNRLHSIGAGISVGLIWSSAR